MPPGFGYRITTFRGSNAQRGGHGSCRVVHLRFAGDGRSGFTITTQTATLRSDNYFAKHIQIKSPHHTPYTCI